VRQPNLATKTLTGFPQKTLPLLRTAYSNFYRQIWLHLLNELDVTFFKSNFTSMFVERMEVLEYRQKFEVELSTFPDSTNTETPRKLVFSLTCVRLSVCLSVCERKSLSVDIFRKSRPI